MRRFPIQASFAVTVAVLCLGALATPGFGRARHKTIVLKQNPGAITWDFGFTTYDKPQQLIGQTFVAPRRGMELFGISTNVAASGKDVLVDIWETDGDDPAATRLTTVEYHSDISASGKGPHRWYRTPIDPGIPMELGKTYSFMLSARTPTEGGMDSALGATGHGAASYAYGEAYCYCPILSDPEHRAWQSATELGTPNYDLAFRLYFRKNAPTTAASPTST